MDLKNIIAAIALSAAVIVLYGLFFAPTQKNIDESELNQVVLVGTIVGIFSVLFALLGVHAYFEVKRAKHYRRTLYFAGLSMFSRGLIIVGPALTLIGMGFLTLAKFQFADQNLE